MKHFFGGKKVFLTGHTGFKGSWFSLWLQRLGAEVSGYSLEPPTTPSLFEKARVAEGMTSTIADVRDLRRLKEAMAQSEAELAFHFAAQPLVRTSYDQPAETFDVNVMGTVNFLEALRATPSVKVAVIVTSDKCYENPEGSGSCYEGDPMGGKDPYSSSKGCAELVTAAYRHSFFQNSQMALATARAGNVIGGGDWAADRLLPDLISAFSEGRELVLRYPKARRPWQHVLEPLRGYLTLAKRLHEEGQAFAEGWNFGPNNSDTWTVERVVRSAAALWGDGACWLVTSTPQPQEALSLRLDCKKAQNLLGWEPALELQTALEWTIAWYRSHHSGDRDLRELTFEQIDDYEERVESQLRELRTARSA